MNKDEKWIPYDKETVKMRDDSIEKTIIKEKINWENKGLQKLDLILKSVGILAIFLPLFCLFLQNRNSIIFDKNKRLSECYVSYSQLNHKLHEKEKVDDYQSVGKFLDSIEVGSKTNFKLYGNDQINKTFNELLAIQRLYLNFQKVNTFEIKSDSVFMYANNLFVAAMKNDFKKFQSDSIRLMKIITINDKEYNNSLRLLNIIYNENDIIIMNIKKSDSSKYKKLTDILFPKSKTNISDITKICTISPSLQHFIESLRKKNNINHNQSILSNRYYIQTTMIPETNRLRDSLENDFEDKVLNEIKN